MWNLIVVGWSSFEQPFFRIGNRHLKADVGCVNTSGMCILGNLRTVLTTIPTSNCLCGIYAVHAVYAMQNAGPQPFCLLQECEEARMHNIQREVGVLLEDNTGDGDLAST